MSLHQDNLGENYPVGYNKKCEIVGLDSFKKKLEKYFFSKVTVRNSSTNSTTAKLVLELDCNFELREMLNHLKLGTWGSFDCGEDCFKKALQNLKSNNDLYIDVDEFSIFLKDTSIIINKIYEKSIPNQLESILKRINDNYIIFTKRLTEVPYEIFVPVFEEGILENDTTLMNIKSGNNRVNDYFKFWGLYFNTEEDAVIYDVKNRSIISGNLHMLNF